MSPKWRTRFDAVFAKVDPTLPVLSLKTYPQHVDSNLQLWTVRAGATLFTVFGGLALTLAIVGVYGGPTHGGSSHARNRNSHALGARPSTVQWMIFARRVVYARWRRPHWTPPGGCDRQIAFRYALSRSARSTPSRSRWHHCSGRPRSSPPGYPRRATHQPDDGASAE